MTIEVIMLVVGCAILLGVLAVHMFNKELVAKLLRQYPVKAIVIDKRFKNWKIVFDDAARVKDAQKTEIYMLKKIGREFKPPSYMNVLTSAGGTDVLFLYRIGDSEFYPVQILDDGLKPEVSEEAKFWLAQTIKKGYDRYYKPGWFEKYASYIYPILAMVGIMLVLAAALKQLDQIMQQAGTIAGAMNNLAQAYAANAPKPPTVVGMLLPGGILFGRKKVYEARA